LDTDVTILEKLDLKKDSQKNFVQDLNYQYIPGTKMY